MLQKRIINNLKKYEQCRADVKGFLYTVLAIELYYQKIKENPSIMLIYKEVGKSQNVSYTSVEKSIRRFIDKLGLNIYNKEFIAAESYKLMEGDGNAIRKT